MNINDLLFQGNRHFVLLKAGVLIAAIALVDWRVIAEIPLGFLYLIPMLMVGGVLGRASILAVAALCTLLAELFSDPVWNPRTGTSRDVLYFAAFLGAGLFIREVGNSRRNAEETLHRIECERDARQEAEDQLNILIESSPVAIITTGSTGCILMANSAAHRLMGVPKDELPGKSIYRFLPALTNVSLDDTSQQYLRAIMQARGQREDGETFLADICFSTYRTNGATRLAAVVVDTSEDLRTYETSGLHQLLEGSKIVVSALSHEIRNVCGAISAVHQNLQRVAALAENRDFEALGSLIEALEQIARINLSLSGSQAAEVDLSMILDELKIVITPSLNEEEIVADWFIEQGLPMVWASRSSLMQVFLNLVANSTRALAGKSQRMLSIHAKSQNEKVLVTISDSGGGVEHPERLFRPFQAGAEATGLGLFLSRGFMRSFGGELRYQPIAGGACFVVELNQTSAMV